MAKIGILKIIVRKIVGMRREKIVYFVIFSGLILRLVKLSELFHFTYDESVFAYVGRRMFVQGHIPLIGGVTPFHVHLAPYFYWLSGLLLWIGNYDPLVWGIFAAILSFFVMLLVYKSGKNIFGDKVALFAAFFYAFSFLINIFDRHYWGIVFNPLISILVFWSLVEIIRGKGKFFLLLSASLAFGFHADPSSWILLLVSLLTIFYFKFFAANFRNLSWPIVTSTTSKSHLRAAVKENSKVNLRYLPLINNWAFWGMLVFLLSFAPLVAFDIRHQGRNIASFKQYLDEIARIKNIDKGEDVRWERTRSAVLFIPKVIARTIYSFGDNDLAKQYAYCPQYSQGRLAQVPWWLVVSALIVLLAPFFLWRCLETKTAKIGLVIIAIYFFTIVIATIFYGVFLFGALFDHYFSTAFVFIAFLWGITLFLLWRKNKLLAGLILFLFIISNSYRIITSRHSFGYQYKRQAVDWVIREIGEDKFALESLGSCFKYYGYRYLFTLAGKEPEKSYTDENFFWLYDRLPAEKHPQTTVVFVSPAEKEKEEFWKNYNHFLSGTTKSTKFAGIEVLIVDNSSGEYNGNY